VVEIWTHGTLRTTVTYLHYVRSVKAEYPSGLTCLDFTMKGILIGRKFVWLHPSSLIGKTNVY